MSEKVCSLRFNQDQGLFSCCMDVGLRIYNVEPLQELRRYDADLVGSVSLCEMTDRSSYIFIVAGGPRPKFAKNQVRRFVDHVRKYDYELTLEAPVKSLRCNSDKLFVILEKRFFVFLISNMQSLFNLETRSNPIGLLEVTPFLESAERQLLVFPGRKVGSIQLIDLGNREAGTSTAPVTIDAHRGELACLSINKQGTLIATASKKGTLIRVWDTLRPKVPPLEFRRGSDTATVYCINFSADSDFMCCSSDKGTVHIFALKERQLNRKSALSNLGILGNYAGSQWALANFTVPPECACICAFESLYSVVATCLDGSFHKYVFSPDGSCNRQCFDLFTDLCDDEEF